MARFFTFSVLGCWGYLLLPIPGHGGFAIMEYKLFFGGPGEGNFEKVSTAAVYSFKTFQNVIYNFFYIYLLSAALL